MYHIRRKRDQEERSIYKDDLEGLEMAVCEANMRTRHTSEPHEVVTDEGKLIYSVEVVELDVPYEVIEPVKFGWNWFDKLCAAWLVAMVLHFIFVR